MIGGLLSPAISFGMIAIAIGGLVTLSQCRSDIAGAAAARVELDRIEEIARANQKKAERLATAHESLRDAESEARAQINSLRQQRDDALAQIPDTDEITQCPADCYLLPPSD